MAARAKQTRQKVATTDSKAARGGGARQKRGSGRKAAPKKDRVAAGAELDLVKQCAQLEAELAGARERIAELEQLNDEAINRIDWVIDSLQTLLESHAKKSP